MVNDPVLGPAYCGSPVDPATLSGAWNFDPLLLALLFGAMAATVWMRPSSRTPATAAIFLVAILFVSPVCSLAVSLFWARTVQHLAVMLLVAPLAAAGLATHAGGLARWAAAHLGSITAANIAVLIAWHLPALYDHVLGDALLYLLLNAMLLGTSILFWAGIRAGGAVRAFAALVPPMMAMAFIGALLVLAPAPLYLRHALAPLAWGLSPLADQQLAGLVMWVGAAPLYPLVALLVIRPWQTMVGAAAWRG